MMILLTIPLLVMALNAIVNTLLFPRLRFRGFAGQRPFVSILIPARNEAGVIDKTVRSLLAQTYTHFELIVLDDHSTDGTGAAALAAGAGDSRLRVLPGAGLPEGWLGKNWACQQLSRAAQGDWLVFTDADVQWQPEALAALVSEMRPDADMLTVWPTQHTVSLAERLVVPLMAFAILGYLPLLLVHRTRWSSFAAANGQCLAFRRSVYSAVGGHEQVRNNIVEDVALARLVKRQGFRLRMVDGAGLIICRMYHNWAEVRAGFGKNILAGHGDSLLLLGLSTVFHWAILIFPWLWLVFGGGLWALSLIALGVGVRLLTAAATRQRLSDALLLPLSAVLMTVIAAQAVWWRMRYGGPRWKGRTIALAKKPALAADRG